MIIIYEFILYYAHTQALAKLRLENTLTCWLTNQYIIIICEQKNITVYIVSLKENIDHDFSEMGFFHKEIKLQNTHPFVSCKRVKRFNRFSTRCTSTFSGKWRTAGSAFYSIFQTRFLN